MRCCHQKPPYACAYVVWLDGADSGQQCEIQNTCSGEARELCVLPPRVQHGHACVAAGNLRQWSVHMQCTRRASSCCCARPGIHPRGVAVRVLHGPNVSGLCFGMRCFLSLAACAARRMRSSAARKDSASAALASAAYGRAVRQSPLAVLRCACLVATTAQNCYYGTSCSQFDNCNGKGTCQGNQCVCTVRTPLGRWWGCHCNCDLSGPMLQWC